MIYLDNHATTPCDPHVVQAMLPYFTEKFGNPSSGVHIAGREAAEAVERARSQVASLLGARKGEIVFTAGATESNNLAIAGVAKAAANGRRRIVTSAIEHKSVLVLVNELVRQHFELVVLPVDREGRILLSAAREAIDDRTLLVSVQAASNEIGTIQNVAEVARLAHEHGALMHTDAAQAVGKILVNVVEWDVDFLSISAHKMYGPKGVGALYIRDGVRGQPISPLLYGGGQEWDLRSGTMNVPGIVGLGEACVLCEESLVEESRRVSLLREQLEQALLNSIPHMRRNGSLNHRLPNNSNLTIPDVDAEALIVNTPEVALSIGSACTSGAPEPSHVLLAIGLSRQEAHSTIRMGLGRFTTDDEIRRASEVIISGVERLTRRRETVGM